MRPIDHLIVQLDKLAGSLGPGVAPDEQALERLRRDFVSLTAPLIGATAAEDAFSRVRTRISTGEAGSLQKLGYMAAFFLEEFDDASMSLEAEDWQEIRETIEDASEEINLAALTSLMDALLSRGLLK
jgi:hypothetical protein